VCSDLVSELFDCLYYCTVRSGVGAVSGVQLFITFCGKMFSSVGQRFRSSMFQEYLLSYLAEHNGSALLIFPDENRMRAMPGTICILD
jgi:hypothetical protein